MLRILLARALLAAVLTAPLFAPAAWSMPEFARRYNLSCSV